MKYAKRMYLVPEEFLKTLERKESLQTPALTQKMLRLDEKMDNILNNKMKMTDEKVSQYNQNLQQFLDAHEQSRQFIPTVKIYQQNSEPLSQDQPMPPVIEDQEMPNDVPLSDNEILDAIPKNSKTLARSMINRLKANKDQLTWNNKGEIVVGGNPVVGSNIIDLISDQLKSRKNFNPTGWETFTETLDRMNMPKYLMRNEKRQNYIASSTPSLTDAGGYAFPPTPPTTPRSAAPTRKRVKPKNFSDSWITF